MTIQNITNSNNAILDAIIKYEETNTCLYGVITDSLTKAMKFNRKAEKELLDRESDYKALIKIREEQIEFDSIRMDFRDFTNEIDKVLSNEVLNTEKVARALKISKSAIYCLADYSEPSQLKERYEELKKEWKKINK